MSKSVNHSIFSPSSAHRWTKCSESARYAEKFPSVPTKESIEGSNAHALAEECFKRGVSAFYFMTKRYFQFEVTRLLATHVQTYVDYVNSLTFDQAEDGSEVRREIEQTVSIHDDSRLFGTADALIITKKSGPFGVIDVVDFKYGKYSVKAHDNPQLMFYALAAHEQESAFEPDRTWELRAHIVQPRSKGDKLSVALFSPVELHKFKLQILNAVDIFDNETIFQDGEHCRFCPGELICPELNKLGRLIL
jgi:Protein of unknown function (DUF2800)